MKYTLILLSFLFFNSATMMAQDVFGKWKTVDEETGEQKSIIEIFKKDGKVFGKVIEILPEDKKYDTCDRCPGDYKGKRIEGLVLIKNLEKDGDEYGGGEIMDPNNGKIYSCYITLEDSNKLKVRGYMGFPLIGRTQYWIRVK